MLLPKKYTQVYKSIEKPSTSTCFGTLTFPRVPTKTFITLCFRDLPKFARLYLFTRFSREERYRNSKWKRLEILLRDFAITLPFIFPITHPTGSTKLTVTDHAQSFNVQPALRRCCLYRIHIQKHGLIIQARNNVNASKSKNIPKYRKTVRRGNVKVRGGDGARLDRMVETYIKRTCVKNGSKNSYRYGRSARIFTPPPTTWSIDVVNNWRKRRTELEGQRTKSRQANLPMTIHINRGDGYIDTS